MFICGFFPNIGPNLQCQRKKADAPQARRWQDSTLAAARGAPAPALLADISEQLGEAGG